MKADKLVTEVSSTLHQNHTKANLTLQKGFVCAELSAQTVLQPKIMRWGGVGVGMGVQGGIQGEKAHKAGGVTFLQLL